MPCFGGRKKKKQAGSVKSSSASAKSHTPSVVQIRQEYNELKSKNEEQLSMIRRQSAELEQLRRQPVDDLEKLEKALKEREEEIDELQRRQADPQKEKELADLLSEKEKQIEELKQQWDASSADLLVKPALEKVTGQLEELKKTNEEAVARLAERENELAELRAELNRRDRKPKNLTVGEDQEHQERQKRLNRLTMDLESDRIMIQKLEELNQQLEAQKQQHEFVLQSHAAAMAEKDRALVQHQKSLSELKASHDTAIGTLEQKQTAKLNELKLVHDRDLEQLKKRLELAETRAKSEVDNEVEQLLREFEQSQHNHSVQVADLHRSHQEQLSVMKLGQEAELSSLERNGAATNAEATPPSTPARKSTIAAGIARWPVTPRKEVELTPKDKSLVQVYVTSISANSAIKRNQESLQTLLQTNHIDFQVIDVAQSEPALQHMRRQAVGKKLPLVFVGGEYRGQIDDLTLAVDNSQLVDFLRPAEGATTTPTTPSFLASPPATPTTPALSVASTRRAKAADEMVANGSAFSVSSLEPVTPTTPNTTLRNPIQRKNRLDSDESLLKALELEMAGSDRAQIDWS